MSQSHTLANRYRPRSFAELKGQEVLVRTITSAIISGKPFNAYLLTGIRGVGKTTSARIVARTLNCSDLRVEGDFASPCGTCDSCLALDRSSHPDVIEIDAASRTGVSDVRELIDSAQYVPMLGRYKIFIVDEVHMLSNSAFNALLKILEEPPANVIFIFATTEFRKIPLTVVSRCQKFDLHRFELQALVDHLKHVCDKENIAHDQAGLEHVARHSDGSMRDALSLLETIATFNGSQATVTEVLVREVLGLADVDCRYKLFEAVLAGDIAQALTIVAEVYRSGCDLFGVFEDLLSVCTMTSKLITVKDYARVLDLPDSEKVRLQSIASQTNIVELTTIWQVVFKGIQNMKLATNVLEASEILLIKLGYLSRLPSVEEVVRGLVGEGEESSGGEVSVEGETTLSASMQSAAVPLTRHAHASHSHADLSHKGRGADSGRVGATLNITSPLVGEVGRPKPQDVGRAGEGYGEASTVPSVANLSSNPQTFKDLAALFKEKGELILHYHLRSDIEVISYQPELGKLELLIKESLPRDLAAQLEAKLARWTVGPWQIVPSYSRTVTNTLQAQDEAALKDNDGATKDILLAFPGAKIESVVSLKEV